MATYRVMLRDEFFLRSAMGVIRYAGSRARLALLAFGLSLISSNSGFAAEPGARQFIVGTSVNVREEPRPDAKIVVKLSIATPVEVVRVQDEWVQLRDGSQAWIGWTLRDLIDERAPTFPDLWEKYQTTPREDLAARRKWLERALALEPINVPALEALASVHEEANDSKLAQQIRREAEFIRNPDAHVDPNERHVVFITRTWSIEPLAFVDGNTLSRVYETQSEVDRFIRRYLRAGRRYELIDASGPAGTATVALSVVPGSLKLDECHGGLGAAVKIDSSRTPDFASLLIATNRPLRSGARISERPLTEAEKRTMSRLSPPFLLKALLPLDHASDREEVERYRAAIKDTPAVSGVAVNLAGGDKEFLVGTVHYRKSAQDAEFSAVVLLVLQDDKSGKPAVLYHHAQGGYGDAILRSLRIVGFMDLNADGVLDIVTEEQGFEHHAILVHQSDRGQVQYKNTVVGAQSGC